MKPRSSNNAKNHKSSKKYVPTPEEAEIIKSYFLYNNYQVPTVTCRISTLGNKFQNVDLSMSTSRKNKITTSVRYYLNGMTAKCPSSHKQPKLKIKEELRKRYFIKSLKISSFKDSLVMALRRLISSKNCLEDERKTHHPKVSSCRKISMMMMFFPSFKPIALMRLFTD